MVLRSFGPKKIQGRTPHVRAEKFNSRDIARRPIKNTGLDENLGVLMRKNQTVAVGTGQYLNLVLSLGTTGLVQTMEEDFIVRAIPVEAQQEIGREYVQESFRQQDAPKPGKNEIEEAGREVLPLVEELGKFWDEAEDFQGSGPGQENHGRGYERTRFHSGFVLGFTPLDLVR